MAATLTEETAQAARIAAQQELYRDLVQRLYQRGRRVELEPMRLDALSTFMAKLVAAGRVSHAELEEEIITYQVQRLQQELRALSTRQR